MERIRTYLPYILLVAVIFATFFIWRQVYMREHRSYILTVAFLDIGQGDAIFIQAPNGAQMLIDSGPDTKVLSRLAQIMPWGDRSINLVLATHTDADHIGGFPYVLDHYKVGGIIENGATNTSHIYTDLELKVKEAHIPKTIARKDMRIVLDKEDRIYFDILFPDRDVTDLESNEGSIVGRLSYGNESFMLTGDAPLYTENIIMHEHPVPVLHSTVLKLGHHGSKYSSSVPWLKAVAPETAVVSAGVGNRYGHPNEETLSRLEQLSIPYVATLGKGTIIFTTDGKTIHEKQIKK